MIMRNVRVLGTAFFLVFVVSVGAASGGTINLSGGSMDFPQVGWCEGSSSCGPAYPVGDRGFTFDGLARAGLSPCGSPDFCAPGDTVNLSESMGTFQGVATLDGISYTDVDGPAAPEIMTFDIAGEAIAPQFGTPATATLVVPSRSLERSTTRQPPVVPIRAKPWWRVRLRRSR
jgi:hypothetical protein